MRTPPHLSPPSNKISSWGTCWCLHPSWASLSNDIWGSGWGSTCCRKFILWRHHVGIASSELTLADARQAAGVTLTALKSWSSPPVWLCCRWVGKRNWRAGFSFYLRAFSSLHSRTGKKMLTTEEEKYNAEVSMASEVKTGVAVGS